MRSILLPYKPGRPIQVFIENIQSVFYDKDTLKVNVGLSGNLNVVQVTVTGDDDANALIYQINAAINSSSVSTVITGNPEIPTTEPTTVVATADYGQISISWDNVTNPAYSYLIYSSSDNTTYSLIGSSAASPFVDEGVAAGEHWYYKVSISSTAGEGPLLTTPVDAIGLIPASPTSPSAIAGYYSVDLSWTGVTGSTAFPYPFYRIYRNSVLAFDNVYNLSVTDVALPGSVQISYDISAVINGVEGPVVNILQTPNSFTAVASPSVFQGIYSNLVSWTAKSGATGYNIYRSESSGTEIFLTSVDTNSFADNALRYDTTYYYKITPTANYGEGPQSSEVSGNPNHATFFSSTGGSILGGVVTFYGADFNSSQGGFMRFGTVTVVDLYCTYTSSTEISISVPGGLTPGSVQFYYMVSGSSYQLPFTVAFT